MPRKSAMKTQRKTSRLIDLHGLDTAGVSFRAVEGGAGTDRPRAGRSGRADQTPARAASAAKSAKSRGGRPRARITPSATRIAAVERFARDGGEDIGDEGAARPATLAWKSSKLIGDVPDRRPVA
jgi:hypothetical protein